MDKPSRNDLHPAMKPVALVERAIRNSSKTRDLVLDPFGGSGATLIACEKAGRHARLIELDPKYVDTIILRWQEFSGGTVYPVENRPDYVILRLDFLAGLWLPPDLRTTRTRVLLVRR